MVKPDVVPVTTRAGASDGRPERSGRRAGASVSDEDPAALGVLEAARALRQRRISARELTDACLRAIDRRNGGRPTFDGEPAAVNAWARLYPELACAGARAVNERIERERDEAPLLCGIPIGLKDLFAVAGLPLTGSGRVLADNLAARDA